MTHAYLYFLSLLAARTVIIVVVLIAGLRLFGKKQMGQMNVYDLVMIMAVANAVQNAMTAGAGDLTVGFVCAGTLLAIGRILTAVFSRLPRLEQRLVGNPTLIIEQGRLMRDNMRREMLTEDDVMAALRQHGLCDPDEAAMAVLEVDGSLSIVPRKGAGTSECN
jgi:uncharacterized membrane protein YcaP (DUF421 family)